MATATFRGVRVSGLAAAVPMLEDRVLDFTEKFGADAVKKFSSTTGVQARRHTTEYQTASDLCYEAARRLIEHKGYPVESFDGLLLMTQTPDYDRPSTAFVLHKRLGLSHDCIAMDIDLGCSGFIYGLHLAAAMVASGAHRRILLCCGEGNDVLNPPCEETGDLLFGDAGSATIVETGEGAIHTMLMADGSGYPAIIAPGLHGRVRVDPAHADFDKIRQRMDGGAVFEFAAYRVPRAFQAFFDAFGKRIDEYDYCVLHQANLFINRHIAKKLKLPLERMPVSMDRYGNTSSCTIPLTISDLRQRETMPEQIRFIASGFGVGLAWGVVDFTMCRSDILPVVETDEYYHEAYTR